MSSFLIQKLDILLSLKKTKPLKTSDIIRSKIERLPKGYVFTYEEFNTQVKNKEAVIKALNRMVYSGKISKLSKGKYFKPENTPFGALQPAQEQIVKDLLEDNRRVLGYLTGLSIYNKLGLTTQVSNSIQIGANQTRPKFKRERYTISFIKQKNKISKKNIPLLQILDCLRYIKKIPDTDIQKSCIRFLEILKNLRPEDRKELIQLSLKYPPSTRALLGALLEQANKNDDLDRLSNSLNPITKYNIPNADQVLNSAQKWNII